MYFLSISKERLFFLAQNIEIKDIMDCFRLLKYIDLSITLHIYLVL